MILGNVSVGLAGNLNASNLNFVPPFTVHPPSTSGGTQYQIIPVLPLLVDDEFNITDITTGQVALNVPCCSQPIPANIIFTASIGDVLTIRATDDYPGCYGFGTFAIENLSTGVTQILVNAPETSAALPDRRTQRSTTTVPSPLTSDEGFWA
jgi:hypothetical protein